MKNVKQVLFLIGAIFFLLGSFTLPLMTCIQKATTHQEIEATVTGVQINFPDKTSRRGHITRTLHYRYLVDGTEYHGSDPRHEVGSSVKPGDKVMVMYRKSEPSDSEVSEYGAFGLKVTLTCLAASGYFLYSFFRNRRR